MAFTIISAFCGTYILNASRLHKCFLLFNSIYLDHEFHDMMRTTGSDVPYHQYCLTYLVPGEFYTVHVGVSLPVILITNINGYWANCAF